MTTEIEADILIFNDKTTNLYKTKKFIADSDYLPETKAYYERLIRIKRAINLMKKGERFLFTEFYQLGLSISQMCHFYKLDSYKLPSTKNGKIKMLASANFKFLLFTTIAPNFPLKDLDDLLLETALIVKLESRSEYPKHVEAYDSFLAADTYKRDLHYILEEPNDYSRHYQYVFNLVSDYSDLSSRAIKEIHPFLKDLWRKGE